MEKIRKLTERECFRLMGYTDEEFDRLSSTLDDKGNSVFGRTALYRFAGNSVVVNCFTAITEEIIKDMERGPRKDILDNWLEGGLYDC